MDLYHPKNQTDHEVCLSKKAWYQALSENKFVLLPWRDQEKQQVHSGTPGAFLPEITT